METLKIGVVIADEEEYVPVRALASRYGAEQGELYSHECHRFLLSENERSLAVTTVLCGIGKVNAAASTAFLIADGAEYIINTGLSGGISGVARGDIVVPSKLLEHDFDLTPLGYRLGEKPNQNYIYEPDEKLVSLFMEHFPFIKTGVMVCGDGFVSDSQHRDRLIALFDAHSCDMESAAAASVCASAGVGFIAVRRISDDAGDSAAQSYTEMNEKAEADLAELVFEGLEKMLADDRFFG